MVQMKAGMVIVSNSVRAKSVVVEARSGEKQWQNMMYRNHHIYTGCYIRMIALTAA